MAPLERACGAWVKASPQLHPSPLKATDLGRARHHNCDVQEFPDVAYAVCTKSINIALDALFGLKFVFSLLKFLNCISSKAKFLPKKCLSTARF
jgi:hypothetical protein